EEKMQFLYQIESKDRAAAGLDSEGEEESARMARDRNQETRENKRSRRHRDYSDSDKSVFSNSKNRICHLCRDAHFVRDCPHLDIAVEAVEKYLEKRRIESKHPKKGKESSSKSYSKGARSHNPSKYEKKTRKTSSRKSRAYAVQPSDSSDSSLEETDNDSSDVESVALSASNIST
ncbi:hypothetical protein K3495_g16858, partial [Podosphaera aphanis]